MAQFAPMLVSMFSNAAADGVKSGVQSGVQGGMNGSGGNPAEAQAKASLQNQAQMPPSVGWMDLMNTASMQGQQPQVAKRAGFYPTQPMNDQNSWWTMYR